MCVRVGVGGQQDYKMIWNTLYILVICSIIFQTHADGYGNNNGWYSPSHKGILCQATARGREHHLHLDVELYALTQHPEESGEVEVVETHSHYNTHSLQCVKTATSIHTLCKV